MLSETEFNTLYAYLFILLADLVGYLFLLLKIYRILCFSKITFDQLPILNPYKWPLSLIRITTKPYFNLWAKILPNLKIGKVSYDVSAILGLEMLSCIISFSLQLRGFSLAEAQRIIS
jgi:hypothetical protein